jgi:pyruvate/2-oxoglutarate dehydrogenase complex dihydrolipoamide dehydrogenase (E3) component
VTRHFDSILIGAGQAAPSLAGRLAKTGQQVAFVERQLFGGTCVNTGCTPTKAMVASARVAHQARRASEYGVVVNGAVTADMKAIKARKDAIVANSRNGVEKSLRETKNCTVFHEHARFVSSHELQVGEETISADQIFLNVGGRAAIPDMPGIKDVPFLTNSTILDLEIVPRHLVVVGGSYVGLEFAQMFHRFGSEVTVVEKGPRLVQHEDEDISDAILQILEKEGIHLRLDAECIAFEKHGEDVSVHVDCTDGDPAVLGSHVLLAVGRVPNTDDLGLDKAGIITDKHGFIMVDDQLRTNVEGIWAIGDCNGKGAFTHTSYNDFEIVAANLLDGEARRVTDRIHAHALYIDPPLGQIGMTETQVRKTGKPALMGIRPMTRIARAIEKGETAGFMKVLVDAESKKILGAAILGTGGDEAVHCILDTMYSGAPYTTITHAVHIHPTVSELIPTTFEDLKPLS